jgi:hypothetical protein
LKNSKVRAHNRRMRAALAFTLLLFAAPAFGSELLPLQPLPAGVPDRDTPGEPAGEGMRYNYPYVKDSYGRFGLLDWCRDWGQQCGRPAAEAFCKQADGGVRPHAADFGHWPKAGHHGNTVIFSTRDTVELPRAEAFTYIVCRK